MSVALQDAQYIVPLKEGYRLVSVHHRQSMMLRFCGRRRHIRRKGRHQRNMDRYNNRRRGRQRI